MFFLYELERVITLHPSFFGPRMREFLVNKLLTDVEGTCTGRYYIICVMDAYEISAGRIVPSNGVAEFTINYRAVVWRPFKGETVDGIVEKVNKMGFFADVGPLKVFVSSHLIPSDIKFDANATPPQFTDNGDQVIEAGTHIRMKLIGTRSDVGSMFAIGSIKEDFLGYNTPPPPEHHQDAAPLTSATEPYERGKSPHQSADDTSSIYRLLISSTTKRRISPFSIRRFLLGNS